MNCPHCDKPMVKAFGLKLKIPTSMVVLHKAGDVEVNCPHCKAGVLLPLTVTTGGLRKAAPPKLRLGISPKAT